MSKITPRGLERMYCDFLDETYGSVKIGTYRYETSHALSEVDPRTFKQGYVEWLASAVASGEVYEVNGEYYDEDPDNS